MDKRIASISVALSAAILAVRRPQGEDVKSTIRRGSSRANTKRSALWVETWRTPFWVPSYSSPKTASQPCRTKRRGWA